MFLVLSKFLVIPFNPVGLTLTLMLSALLVMFIWRRVKISMILFSSAFFVIFLFSSPLVSRVLMRGLEQRYLPSVNYDKASAVVLLGGATVGQRAPRINVETNADANRIFNSVRVFRQSGSEKLVLSGGVVEVVSNDTVPEAHSAFLLLNELFGIDSADVLLEPNSRNTRENALYTKKVMEEAGLGNDIILVTSAYHMPRSAAIFRKAGFIVTPAPAGFYEEDYIGFKLYGWLPNAGSLFRSTIALHEYYGIAVYKILGWM
ncbi:MAG: YdcF family protein [Chitinispirillia bacterium]|nr:YdcF family protein [Chitinispirillia bacterium]